ncbi:hypothetical protein DFH08DRAFT_869534 [Mycena albidolilacea]|uniref:Uncharacterized protein n=1 Tax=Mycena albidolilacea TaxID=1033008 RepID=A0AAD7ES90_9AGAR|nr:hypothetical protein DFH08DRAFT_869534 [Mycena albidolilacea]
MHRFSMRVLALAAIALLPFAAAQTVTVTDAVGEVIVENVTVDENGLPTTVTLLTIASTLTTTDRAGNTLVEVVTGDGQGDSTTQTIQTIPAADAGGGQGPVGQPGATGTPGAPTPFTYTTTDANGETTAVIATFTPSFATTVIPAQTFQATVLDYSAYTASYVTGQAAQAAQQQQNGALSRTGVWWGPCVSALVGVVGGAVLLMGA